jgi:hypothetical protein
MATSQSITISHFLRGKRFDSSDLVFGQTNLNHSTSLTLTPGVGVNEADVAWSDTRLLVAGASEVLDLAGVLVNLYGETKTFAKIKVIKISTPENNAHNISVTRHAAQGVPLFTVAGAGIILPPGGEFAMQCGGIGGLCSVVPGSADLLTLVNTGSLEAVSYSITIGGTST